MSEIKKKSDVMKSGQLTIVILSVSIVTSSISRTVTNIAGQPLRPIFKDQAVFCDAWSWKR